MARAAGRAPSCRRPSSSGSPQRAPVALDPDRASTAPPVAVLDRDGRVLARTDAPPPGLGRWRGWGWPARPAATWRAPTRSARSPALPDALRSQVTRFVLRAEDGPGARARRRRTRSRREVQLGSLARVRAKATAALAVLDTLRARRATRVRVLGVQVPDAPVTDGRVLIVTVRRASSRVSTATRG